MNENKDKIIADLIQENKNLRHLLAERDARIAALEEKIAPIATILDELRRRANLDSSTSGKPPSSDGLRKKNRTSSLRNSNKPKGGQKGHKGKTLEQTPTPDKTVKHTVSTCKNCQNSLENIPARDKIIRQVFDIIVQRNVVEHQAEVKICGCGCKNIAAFPEAVKGPVQYGENLKDFAIYLIANALPKDRLDQIFEDLFGISISDTTLFNYESECAENLKSFHEDVLQALKEAPVKHQDESGVRVEKKTQWMHVISNKFLTHLWHSPKRGTLLEGVKGIIVHDHWKPYFTMKGVDHALCMAHLHRELKALIEHDEEAWASKMKRLFKLIGRIIKKEDSKIPRYRDRIALIYSNIVSWGIGCHEALDPLPRNGKRGKPKRRTGHNLLIRLQSYKTEVLRCLMDIRVPMTNNQAEQDIRFVKVKQKISGCFRTTQGINNYAKIQSLISTLRKNGLNILDGIRLARRAPVRLADILPSYQIQLSPVAA